VLTIRALLPHTRVTGGVRRFLELGNRFKARGHHFVLFKPELTPPAWFDCRFPFLPLDTIRAHPYDVTLCGDAGLLHLLPQAKSKLRVLVATGDSHAGTYATFLAEHPNTLVIGNSGAWKEYLPAAKGVAIPGGVNLEQFSPRSRGDGPYTVTALGTLERNARLIDAVRELKWNDTRIRIVTNEISRVPLKYFWMRKRIEQVDGRNQEALVRLYRESDVFVTTESTAGWSNPAAEAMACGVPVICTRWGTTDFADASTAIVVPDGEALALAFALKSVRGDPAAAKARSAAGLERMKVFDWERVTDAMLRVFEGCIASAGGSFAEVIARNANR
jgi:glycosyltransferase involved in cell wall biosynthesis